MLTLDLKRVLSCDEGTFGVIIDQHAGRVICTTAELPWKDNARRVSCIPPGTYLVDPKDTSTKFGDDWMWVTEVPNRSRVGIHKGNWPKRDSRGCILVGTSFFLNERGQGVGSSSAALDALFAYSLGELFYLNISHPAATTVRTSS